MIQEFLKNQAKPVKPDLEWSVDYYTGLDRTGTVYYEGGRAANKNDEAQTRRPEYMIFIRSSDFSEAEVTAHKLYKLFHMKTVEELVCVPELETCYRVYFIEAVSEPSRLGVSGDVMEYSLNLLITMREETNDGRNTTN